MRGKGWAGDGENEGWRGRGMGGKRGGKGGQRGQGFRKWRGSWMKCQLGESGDMDEGGGPGGQGEGRGKSSGKGGKKFRGFKEAEKRLDDVSGRRECECGKVREQGQDMGRKKVG